MPRPRAAGPGRRHRLTKRATSRCASRTDGVILVDTKYPWHVDELLEKVRSVTSQPIKYVLNSHYHPDHTGANADDDRTRLTRSIVQRNLRDEILGTGAAVGRT